MGVHFVDNLSCLGTRQRQKRLFHNHFNDQLYFRIGELFGRSIGAGVMKKQTVLESILCVKGKKYFFCLRGNNEYGERLQMLPPIILGPHSSLFITNQID